MIKTSHQVVFWTLTFLILNVLFGAKWSNYLDSFYFTTMLMPLAIATSYFFNSFLVPNYLQIGRKIRFTVYTLYTIIASLFLSAAIGMISFIVLTNLNWSEMSPLASDVIQLGMIIYFIAILFSFIHLYNVDSQRQSQIQKLKARNEKNLQQTITVRSNRKAISITIDDLLYIESLADYVKMHTTSETIITKEKIGVLAEKLPEQFIRIHRSYLINQNKLEAFGHDFIQVNSEKLPLGRKYKKEALDSLSINQIN